jgi:hypothetical protein
VITSDSDHTHDGVSFRDHQVQLSIFSEAAATGDQIRDAFLTLLDGKRLQIPGIDEATSFLESVDHLYEADTKLHHTAITIEVSIAE